MATHFQPSDDDIEMLMVLSGGLIPRPEAIARLKGNNNNAEQAINEYYDNSSGTNKYRWDDSQFSSSREGEYNNHGISFDIQGADEHGPAYSNERINMAPSRPPSRASNNKSPLSKVIDLTAEHAAADPRDSMNHDYNDPELAQALAASRADLGMEEPPQISGVTGSAPGGTFGPATRSEYDSSQWGMVTVGKSTAEEISLDPSPAERKRDMDQPAFLKPSIQDHRLNALITIYHEIPLTRNLFLDSEQNQLSNYGYDAEWWTGSAIELPVQTVDGQELLQSEVDKELQRLMAFLDNTERSYASVDALANLREVKQELRSKPDIPSSVLSAWRKLHGSEHVSTTRQIFSIGVPSEKDETDEHEFAVLELTLPHKDSSWETLYDIADEVLWQNLGSVKLEQSAYLSHVAEVIAFKLDGGDESKPVEVPLVWYPDRYLRTGREAAYAMRMRKRDVDDRYRKIQTIEEKLTHAVLKSGKIVTVQDLFKASLKHDEAQIKDSTQLVDVDVDMLASQTQSAAAVKLSDDLQKVFASIDKKLLALEVEKEKARQELRELSKLYTAPSDDPESPALHKYSLRGVSTSKSTMFVCRRSEDDLIEMADEGDEPSAPKEQWWKIHYAPVGTSPVTVEKTTTESVTEAMKESRNLLLVYASENAVNYPRQNLPKALETFVKFDNATFRAECNGSEDTQTINGDPQTVADDDLPVGLSSPGKRKFDESSLVNQASNPYARVNIKAREMRSSDDSEANTSTSSTDPTHFSPAEFSPDHEVIMGIDPSKLRKDSDGVDESKPQSPEMQERSGMPMLSSRPKRTQTGAVDSMDLDQVMEDNTPAGESAAVKRVGFAE